jgi:radical SAM protein with 4Fe4S-binding SPASM domain
LTNLHLENVMISFRSIDEHAYNNMFGNSGMFQRTLRNVLDLRERGNHVTINVVLTRENAGGFQRLKTFFCEQGFPPNTIGANPVHPRVSGDATPVQFLPESSVVEQVYRENPEFLALARDEGAPLACVAGRSLLAVDFRGDVHACTLLSWPVGNVRSASLAQIWHEATLFRMLRMLGERGYEKCRTCPAHRECAACIAQNFMETGSLWDPGPTQCNAGHLMHQIGEEMRRG